MWIKCRGFEGAVLEVTANEEIICGMGGQENSNILSYNIKFRQKTGEIIEIRNISSTEFEVSTRCAD